MSLKPFSFIHAADLHLDSPFKGITAEAPFVADKLRSATFDAYESLIKLCIEKEVNFLLIAGDVYDGADRSLRAQLKFRDGLEKLRQNNIGSYIVHGNHDPLDGWSSAIELPQGAHRFGYNKVETVTFNLKDTPAASVSGISFQKKNEQRNFARLYSKKDFLPDTFNVGLLHCSVGLNPAHETYAPCELKDLTKAGIDYWALGHVHEKAIMNKDPYVVYPGNTQGRNIREQGERGCYLVNVDEERNIEMEFIALDAIRWFSISVSIDGLETIDQLDRSISNSIYSLKEEAEPRHVVCRVNLVGRGPLYKDLQRESAVAELKERLRDNYASDDPFVWVEKIKIDCRPEFDIESLRKNKDFLGQVLSISEEIRVSERTIDEVMGEVFSELYKNRRVEKAIPLPSTDELMDMLREAELFCIDKLEADE